MNVCNRSVHLLGAVPSCVVMVTGSVSHEALGHCLRGLTLALGRWPDACFKAFGPVQATGFNILLTP